MRTIQKLAAIGGALSLAASCTSGPTGPVTDLPNSVEYGRRITLSYAASQAAAAERCAPINPEVLNTSRGIGMYNAPGVVHSASDNAADAFINQQIVICRMSAYNSEEIAYGSLLIAEFSPVGGAGYLRIGHERNTGAGSAFWVATEAAATLAEETGHAPWQDAFACRIPYTVVNNGGGHYERVLGTMRCLPVLSAPLRVAPAAAPIERNGLRGPQQPNTEDSLNNH